MSVFATVEERRSWIGKQWDAIAPFYHSLPTKEQDSRDHTAVTKALLEAANKGHTPCDRCRAWQCPACGWNGTRGDPMCGRCGILWDKVLLRARELLVHGLESLRSGKESRDLELAEKSGAA